MEIKIACKGADNISLKEYVAYISYTVAKDWLFREKDKKTVERLAKGRLKKIAKRVNVTDTNIDSIIEMPFKGEGEVNNG